jgi:hypothetical protein
VVTLEKTDGRLTGLTVEQGALETVNVPMPGGAASFVVPDGGLTVPGVVPDAATPAVQVIAADVRVSGTNAREKFGVEGVPLTLAPGIRVTSTKISTRFAPAAFNPAHTRYIARSAKAKPMAVNMYSGWWSLVVCVLVTVLVSLFTRPKPDHELTNLVMGLTPLPDPGPCPWYQNPKLWAAAIIAVLVAVNMYSGWWSLVVCVFVTVLVSLFTKPKPDAELKNLVYGLTPLPDEGPCAWYERPILWASVVAAGLVAINVLFW